MEKLGIVKTENGTKKVNWKILGIAISLFTMLLLFALLLVIQLIPFFSFVDKNTWVESVKYCIEKWLPIASVECGGMAIMGAVDTHKNDNPPQQN